MEPRKNRRASGIIFLSGKISGSHERISQHLRATDQLRTDVYFPDASQRQNIHIPAPDFHACAGQLHVADSEKTPVWEFLWKHPWYFLIYISAALWFAAVILPDRMQYARMAGKICGYCRKQLGKLYIHPQLVRCTRWQITMYYQVLSAVVPECV